MILLSKTFHHYCEGLDLSLQGNGVRFVTLIIGGCFHQTSKYHAAFCPRSGECGLYPKFPQMVPTDDTEKIVNKPHDTHALETIHA